MDVVQGILQSAWQVFSYAWWLWLPILLWPLFESTWLFWRQEIFKRNMPFVLLEIRIPREVRKSPRAMEQVLMTIHGLRNVPSDLQERWWDGEVTRWYSLEIVSIGGEIHFYVRAPAQQRPIVEAAFFSYYPDVEVAEVDDYVDRLPTNMGEVNKSGYDLWGSELVLAKEDAYPIKSYLDFESPEEEKQYDPISSFLEVLGKVKKEEIVCIQIVIAPAAFDWKDKWKSLVETLRLRTENKMGGPKYSLGLEFPHILPTFPVKGGEAMNGKELSAFSKTFMRTPGETDVLKAVEDNLSRPAFETLIRYIYLTPRELFTDVFPRRGILGAFNQYGSLDLNMFRHNLIVTTLVKFWRGGWQLPNLFPASRSLRRKQRILMRYRARGIPPGQWMGKLIVSKLLSWEHSKCYMLTTRSIATLFHPPTYLVLTAPHVKRVESKKAGPPAGLAIFGEEEEIEKYH